MQERIKQIPTKFVEFWNKYTGVQKTIIISVICVVLLAIGLTTVSYTHLTLPTTSRV